MENQVKTLRPRTLKGKIMMIRRRKHQIELMRARKAEEESKNHKELQEMEPKIEAPVFCEKNNEEFDDEGPLSITHEINAVKQYPKSPLIKKKPMPIIGSSSNSTLVVEIVKCRCCLVEAVKVFCRCIESKMKFGSSFVEIKQAILYATGVELFEDKTKPNHICPDCLASIKAAYKFKEDLIKAQNNLDEQKAMEQEGKVGWFDQNHPPIEPPPAYASSYDKTEELTSSLLCPHCGIEFPDAKKLRRHRANVETVQVLCDYCGEEFTKMRRFLDHVKEHTMRLECPVCKKILPSCKSLWAHKRIHMNPRKYQCPDCDECFVHRDRLVKHKSKHTGVELFVCKICSRSLYSNYSLGVHMRIHTGEQPYVCKICNKGFAHNVSLKTHMKKGCKPEKNPNNEGIEEESKEMSDDGDNEG